jgi:hypothetical protein
MPAENLAVLLAIVCAFGVFAVTLGWVSRH